MPGKINASLSNKLKNVEWGEYRLGDLFSIDNNWIYGKNKQWKTRFKTETNGRLPVISGITVNNGINYYTEDQASSDEIFADSLTISTRGEYSGTVTYHSGIFVLANNILVMSMPELNKKQKLFMATIINKLNYGGYNNYPRIETLKKDKVYLPSKNGKVDFDFMENLIKELEAERIEKLSEYLNLKGLSDYKLTSEDSNIINQLNIVNTRKVDIEYIFKVQASKKKFNANTIKFNGKYPYVARGSSNNGIKGYINENVQYLNEGKTISFGQDTATMFYQNKPYFTGDKIKIMKFKDGELLEDFALYLITAMRKSFQTFAWGQSSFNEEIIKSVKLELPVKGDKIDYEFMKKYIKVLKKLIVKEVIEWKNKK